MVAAKPIPTRERFFDLVVEKVTPQEIVEFEASDEEKEYVHELFYRQSAGTLTPEEADYLDRVVEFEMMMAVLKAKAFAALNRR